MSNRKNTNNETIPNGGWEVCRRPDDLFGMMVVEDSGKFLVFRDKDNHTFYSCNDELKDWTKRDFAKD